MKEVKFTANVCFEEVTSFEDLGLNDDSTDAEIEEAIERHADSLYDCVEINIDAQVF